MAVGKYEMFICKNYSFELFVFRDFLRSYFTLPLKQKSKAVRI